MGSRGGAPYSVQMDACSAFNMVKNGASLLLLHVPQGTLLGIDTKMFAVGPKFKGIKMVPPGPHFVYYSSTSRIGDSSSPIVGFFIHPNQGETIVRQWDLKEERLMRLSDGDEEERYQLAVKNLEFDQYLGAYDLQQYRIWKQLSKYITVSVIERHEPLGGEISVIDEADLAQVHPQTREGRKMAEHLRKSCELYAKRFPMPSSERESEQKKAGCRRCFYSTLPHLVKLSGATGVELTSINLDKSVVLEDLLRDNYGGSEDALLGELQFAFIAFLLGQSLESFHQWKSIVRLMLGCEDAPLSRRTHMFVKFLEVIHFQLKTSLQPDDVTKASSRTTESFLDDSWFAEDNFLRLLCKEFFAMVMNAKPIDGALLEQARKLKTLLKSAFGWDFDTEIDCDEDDEYAPVVIVETESMEI